MFDRILTINKNSASVKLGGDRSAIKDLINLHVVFEDNDKKILGEIDSISEETVNISFLGELTSNNFIGGLIRKPSMDSKVELKILTGNEKGSIPLGISPLYNGYPLNVSIDDLFSNHTAIFGNTGSGKTNGICRIIQNAFPSGDVIPYKANLFIFDSYGEYINAFSKLSDNNKYYKLIMKLLVYLFVYLIMKMFLIYLMRVIFHK